MTSVDAVAAKLAGACAQARPAGPADAVGGLEPRYVAAPASTAEASAILRTAAELDLAVVARGAGTRLDWGAAPERCDLIVETRLLDAVLEHAAGDLVVRAQAGVRLGQLAEVLAGAGQRLALDPPALDPPALAGGSVGGLVATGVAGPLRLRYGTPRDLLIGITMVRADGTVARAGGKVVKNVAGYDLGKLLAGSYGTLGLITEATFRLHPRPAAVAYVSLSCSGPSAAADAVLAAAASTLAPSAVELSWPSGDAPLDVAVLLEGDETGAAERAARMRDLLTSSDGGSPQVSEARPAWWGRGAAAAASGTVLQIGFWAGRLAEVLGAVRDAAARTGLDPAVSGSAGAGVLHAALPADAPPDAAAHFVADLRAALSGPASPAAGTRPARAAASSATAATDRTRPARAAASRVTAATDRTRAARAAGPNGVAGPAGADRGAGPRSSVVVLHAPPEVRAVTDLWGPIPAVALMRAVKDRFDPEHRLAPGRAPRGA